MSFLIALVLAAQVPDVEYGKYVLSAPVLSDHSDHARLSCLAYTKSIRLLFHFRFYCEDTFDDDFRRTRDDIEELNSCPPESDAQYYRGLNEVPLLALNSGYDKHLESMKCMALPRELEAIVAWQKLNKYHRKCWTSVAETKSFDLLTCRLALKYLEENGVVSAIPETGNIMEE